MNEWVWLIGGSIMAVPTALEIKQRGYKLLVTDLDPDSPCRQLADRFELISVYDAQANLSLAKRLDFRPVAVLTAGTDAGVEVATVAAYFNLPGIHPQIAKQVRNKGMMRDIIKAEYPRFRVGVTMDHFRGWDIYPCGVKPVDAAGSKGFSVVCKEDELSPALVKARMANRGNISPVLVEELLIPQNVIPGLQFDTAEIALDFLVYEGKVTWINGALRLFWKNKPGIEAGHFNPYCPDDSIIEQVQNAAGKLGVKFGSLKVDFMQDARYGWVIQEMATRSSGGFDSSYTAPLATGKNVVGAILDVYLGQPIDPEKLTPKRDRVACCYAPILKPGKIAGWIKPTKALEEVAYIFTNDKDGEIKPLESNADRALFVICDAPTREEALEKCLRVAEQVKPLYEEE